MILTCSGINCPSGLPYALSQAGFFTGIFLLITLGWVTDWTIRLILINAKLSGRNSYIEIMHRCFGESGRAAVSLFQFSFAFGGQCTIRNSEQTCLIHSPQACVPLVLSWVGSPVFLLHARLPYLKATPFHKSFVQFSLISKTCQS